jgi:capsular polysaccharide biosynthesis protein
MTGRDLTPFTGGRAEQPEESGTVVSGPISLSFLKSALRRRRWVWIATALVGLMLGASYRVAEPPKYQAVADLFLLEPSNADPNVAIGNEVNLAQTVPVATLAVQQQHWNVPPLALLGTYKASSIGDQILRITAKAKYQAEALAIANGVSHAYIDWRAESLESQNQTAVAGLQKEINELQNQAGPAGSAGTLTNTQTAAELQITTLQNQISTDNQQVETLTANSKVIDPAALLKSTRKKVVIRDGVAGLIGGLALGMAFVVGQAVLSDRVRRRDEVAEALGAPVELSIGPYRRPRLFRSRRLAMQVTHPSPEMQMVARRLSSHLEQAPGAALAVVSVECSELAALAVASVALSLADEGGRVTVVDLADGRPLQSLLKLPELDPAGPGEIDFHASPDPKKSILVRAEEWRQAHVGRDRPIVRRSGPRRGTMPTTTRPVVSPTSIRDPLGSWAAWDMRHESVDKWSSRDNNPQRAWGSLRPAEAGAFDDVWDSNKIHELKEHISDPVEEPLVTPEESFGTPDEPFGTPAEASSPESWAEERATAPEESDDDQPEEQDSSGALSRIHPSPVPLVAKRGSVTVVTGPDDPVQIGVHRSNSGVDAVLVLATVSPAFGASHIASWATESVVMISAGEASAARITATGQMLESGGVKVDSAILVGADRHDETVGLAGNEPAEGTDQDRGWVQKRTWGNRG